MAVARAYGPFNVLVVIQASTVLSFRTKAMGELRTLALRCAVAQRSARGGPCCS